MKALRYVTVRAVDHFSAMGRRNAVFIWIPKTAGTSLFEALKLSGCRKFKKLEAVTGKFSPIGLVTFGHMNYAELAARGVVTEQFNSSSFKFSFSRNPFARAASLYLYSKKIGVIDPETKFADCLAMIRNDGCPPNGLYNRHGLSQWNPQTSWIDGITMDFIGRVESIAEDYLVLQQRLGLQPTTIQVLNQSQTKDYRTIFDANAVELVRQIYRSDFDRFEYSDRL